jgi:hypothetical protein
MKGNPFVLIFYQAGARFVVPPISRGVLMWRQPPSAVRVLTFPTPDAAPPKTSCNPAALTFL